MITDAFYALWNYAISPLASMLAGLVPSPPSWVSSNLAPLESGMNYLGAFVCWPAVYGFAMLVVAWRLAIPAWHLALRLVNVFTLGGFQR